MARVSKTFLWSLYLLYITVLFACALSILYLAFHAKDVREAAAQLLDYKNIQQFDPLREGGHLLPNIDGWMKGETLDRPVRIITNSKGFRNAREFDYAISAHSRRILFLGDSYVDGMRTDQVRTIGYLLEQRLNSEACSDDTAAYEVMISGHNNPANAWYYYQEFGRRYHPQIVVLGVTLGNDLTWHAYRSTFQPAISSRNKRILIWQKGGYQSKPAQGWFPVEAYVSPEQWMIPERIESRLRGYLHDLFPRWGGYLVPAATYPSLNDRRQIDMHDFSTSLGLFYQPILPEVEQEYVSFFEVLDGLSQAVTDDGAHFIAVLFPTRLQSSIEEWKLFLKFYFLNPSKFDLAYPNHRIMDFCGSRSLSCLDLLPSFQAHYQDGGGHLYRPHGDMHLNEAGQELASNELFSFMRQSTVSGNTRLRPCAES